MPDCAHGFRPQRDSASEVGMNARRLRLPKGKQAASKARDAFRQTASKFFHLLPGGAIMAKWSVRSMLPLPFFGAALRQLKP
jgi:hypothetical protein